MENLLGLRGKHGIFPRGDTPSPDWYLADILLMSFITLTIELGLLCSVILWSLKWSFDSIFHSSPKRVLGPLMPEGRCLQRALTLWQRLPHTATTQTCLDETAPSKGICLGSNWGQGGGEGGAGDLPISCDFTSAVVLPQECWRLLVQFRSEPDHPELA